ncbi:hypothetical protein Axy21_003 [Achromobacter phage vB_AxyP_19-32_Axy21]|uniref:Uncharacterized protein n=1 Tax=Achromobacter phage vB_AxyP_19-32_Axy21 TaxID=2591045 RepID=A0A514CVT2_9CAUD|nr:hypothetical protein Axy21_003 [Achromobacter phage vB_AxyP_19-32_Axy21]
MSAILAFLKGVREFRSSVTTSYDHTETAEGYRLQARYEHGRDLAHCLTLRYWDDV